MESLSGLLHSRIGYDLGMPKRVIIRSTQPDAVPQDAFCDVRPWEGGTTVLSVPFERWGQLWDSSWWIADISGIAESGTYVAIVGTAARELMRSGPIRVGPDLLWERTWRAVALEQLERRVLFARERQGWADCGSVLREANSHAVMIDGLCDVLEHAGFRIAPHERRGVEQHIVHGCDYLGICQDLAAQQGFGEGALIHEPAYHKRVIPGDVAKAAVAFARSARLLPAGARPAQYLDRARRAMEWLRTAPLPVPDGFSAWAHGAPDGFAPPADFMTRDLLTITRAAWELAHAGLEQYRDRAVALAERVIARQVPPERSEDGLYGHFYSFDNVSFTEKAWEHNGVGHDCGATYPHYLLPLIEMYRAMPEHPRAGVWRTCVENFAFGYLVPACARNPFFLLPQGVFGDEGLLVFAGLWHGANGAYCHAAVLALELEKLFGGSEFREIATANLQWIAGLNAGITRESLAASHVWTDDVPDGVAEPRSMIFGIGDLWAGSWRTIRGSICNGFDIDQQFRFETRPSRTADGPYMFTDEDWIVHAGAWLSAVSRLASLGAFGVGPR